MVLTVLRSIKKALSIVPKLSPRIVLIDTNCAVTGYASGENEQSFMQLVDNGVFVMTINDGDDVMIVDGNDRLDDGNEYIGKLSLICFGPTSKFFASTLAMGGQLNRTAEGEKEGSRKAQRKVNAERSNMDREVGINRGMTMHACMQCAFMAQIEDDAVQRHRDMHMVMLTKSIESTERLGELKMKMSDRMGVEGLETHSLMAINLFMDKLEQLSSSMLI